jgi:hypothetical protein
MGRDCQLPNVSSEQRRTSCPPDCTPNRAASTELDRTRNLERIDREIDARLRELARLARL